MTMDRKTLINRLVAKKMNDGSKARAFCVCLAARQLCVAGVEKTVPVNNPRR
jgi:hypothetical protein